MYTYVVIVWKNGTSQWCFTVTREEFLQEQEVAENSKTYLVSFLTATDVYLPHAIQKRFTGLLSNPHFSIVCVQQVVKDFFKQLTKRQLHNHLLIFLETAIKALKVKQRKGMDEKRGIYSTSLCDFTEILISVLLRCNKILKTAMACRKYFIAETQLSVTSVSYL